MNEPLTLVECEEAGFSEVHESFPSRIYKISLLTFVHSGFSSREQYSYQTQSSVFLSSTNYSKPKPKTTMAYVFARGARRRISLRVILARNPFRATRLYEVDDRFRSLNSP